MKGRLLFPVACVLWALLLLGGGCGSDESEPGPEPPAVVYAVVQLPEPTANWSAPVAVAVGPNSDIWVVDSALQRIVELNLDGEVVRVLCETDECSAALNQPLGITYYQGSLYVANSGDGTVVVLSTTGTVERTISIPTGPQSAAEPVDVIVADNGEIYVSDPANQRVLHLGPSGILMDIVLSMDADDPRYTTKEPRGLALDEKGNLYVADAGQGIVKKYSPDGRYLQMFVTYQPAFASPKDIAIGPADTLYMISGKHALLQVFSPGGRRLGAVGYVDPARQDSSSLLSRPEGVAMSGNLLFVVDPTEGLFAFEIDPAYWGERLQGQPDGQTGTSPLSHGADEP